MKIGLFGGSFDPVHLGHLLVARAAREEAGAGPGVFHSRRAIAVQAGRPARPGRGTAALLRLALAGDTTAEVDDQEIRRGGVSYTIDTVRDYAGISGAELFYLIGADQAGNCTSGAKPRNWRAWCNSWSSRGPGEALPELAAPFRGRALRGVSAGGVLVGNPGAPQGGTAGHAFDAARRGGGAGKKIGFIFEGHLR
jgi:nicotinate-nucleotide adenylyltransferase